MSHAYGARRNWGEGTGAIVTGYVYTSVFCIAIALLLYFVGLTGSLGASFVTSFAIGLSIQTAFALTPPRVGERLSPYLASVPTTLLGLMAGLLIAGVWIGGNPWFYFSSDYRGLLLGCFFAGAGFFIVSARLNVLNLRARLAQAEADAVAQQKQLLETELRLLQAQVEPHFLFNTLSNIVGLVRDEPALAEQTLHNLTRLLRGSLERTREAATTLDDELEIIRAYLEIQQVRMRHRLVYSMDVDDAVRERPFPPLLLQPLVENAVKHGIEPQETGGRVAITARDDGGRLRLSVSDTGGGMDAAASAAGVGLRNVRQRLRGLYGHDGALHLAENVPNGLVATLVFTSEGA